MNFNFSVDMPKKIKRVNGMGEDAPPVSKDGILIVCDGTGATGQSKHNIDGTEYTSAYLGSRRTSEITDKFLSENYDKIIDSIESPEELCKLVSDLGNEIRTGLSLYVEEKDLQLTFRGKSFKLLPTTLTAAVYKIYDDHIDIIAFSAGDSRILLWESSGGLHQLSVDDVDSGYDAFSDVSNTNNCISADNDFRINYVVHKVYCSKCVLLATSDGFTDPIKPFDQERSLIELIGNCSNVLDIENSKLADDIGVFLDENYAGFTGKDDCSIAGVIIGYDSDEDIKNSFKERYKYVAETFIKPYRDLDKKCREAMDIYNGTVRENAKYADGINAAVKRKLTESASLLLPSNYMLNPEVYEFLASQPCINSEISKINTENEMRLNNAQKLLEQAETEARRKFAEFLKLFCIVAEEHGNSVEGLPADLAAHIRNYSEVGKSRNALCEKYNSALSQIKLLYDVDINSCSSVNSGYLSSLCSQLADASKEIETSCRAAEEAEKAINNFFSPENSALIVIYERYKADGFAGLDKKIEYFRPTRGFLPGFLTKEEEKDADYRHLKDSKKELENIYAKVKQARANMESVRISENERLQRYKNVINANINELVNVVKQNSNVFSFFAGTSKTEFDKKMTESELASENAISLVRLKNDLWQKYKPEYEMFAIAEKKYIVVLK